MRILAISGSLRAQSTNCTLLHAFALASPNTEVTIYGELALIPPFNPDIEEARSSIGPVAGFRTLIRDSDAVVFSTPEYAHGLPGSLKNALDWIVGTGELYGKPVALMNASSRAVFAQASLREVLRTLAHLIDEAEITIDQMGKKPSAEEIAANSEFAAEFRRSVHALTEAVGRLEITA